MHDDQVFNLATTAAAARVRPAADWREDTHWHRRMFGQARFRWLPEDAMSIATRYAQGRLEFSSARHLAALDQASTSLLAYADQVRLAMAAPVREIRDVFGPDWHHALAVAGMTEIEAQLVLLAASGQSLEASAAADVARVTRGLPVSNPLTEVWEIRQLHGMYLAAHGLLEDTFADLVHELSARTPWVALATLTSSHSVELLRARLEEQSSLRGPLGDPRRLTVQTFAHLPAAA